MKKSNRWYMMSLYYVVLLFMDMLVASLGYFTDCPLVENFKDSIGILVLMHIINVGIPIFALIVITVLAYFYLIQIAAKKHHKIATVTIAVISCIIFLLLYCNQ